jgi:hypothetical protein
MDMADTDMDTDMNIDVIDIVDIGYWIAPILG